MIASYLLIALAQPSPAAPAPLVLPLAANPPGIAAPRVQDPDDEVPDKRPEVEEKIDRLVGLLKKKQDDEVVEMIDDLYQEFAQSGPKDRAAIVKGLERVFKEKRRKNEDETFDNKIFFAAAVAMGDMGPESVKGLIGLIGHKNFDKDMVVQRQAILSLGKTRDEDGIKPLTKLLNDENPAIQAAGAEALGQYEEFELKERKQIFEALLKTIMRVRAIVDTDPEDLIARDRYDVIAGPIITSLQRLSGHDERDPHKWQSWWNNNKKKDWDEEL